MRDWLTKAGGLLGLAACFLTAANGQIAQNSLPVDQSPAARVSPAFPELDKRLHFGDLIEVDVIGSTEFDWRGRLSPEGFLSGVRFTGNPIFGLCRTGDQVAVEVEKAFGKFLKDPRVTVEILDRSKRPLATLFGAVVLPQRFQLEKDVNLRELLVLSGGFSENTGDEIEIYRQPAAACVDIEGMAAESGQEATLLRESELAAISIKDILAGKNGANPAIFYGDLITVKRASPVYVIGNVGKPGEISHAEKLTVRRAIDAAGGILSDPSDVLVRVYRRNSGKTDIFEIDSDDSGNASIDKFILKEYDIVEVFGKGSQGSKFPPVLQINVNRNQDLEELPVRVIK